jgi:hypothetical protein
MLGISFFSSCENAVAFGTRRSREVETAWLKGEAQLSQANPPALCAVEMGVFSDISSGGFDSGRHLAEVAMMEAAQFEAARQ